ncbi:MAG: glycosyltransferase family 4 protein [Deltaproteobacteria bacterium]|nr:MAG: glycosyltransferase family 4 protein [Deltaproteobacteria bacterium]
MVNIGSQSVDKESPPGRPLRICLLTYRGNPTCGGQGVYIKHLSLALSDLGHQVDVISGPPYPELDGNITLHRMPGLDLYNPEHLFKVKRVRDLRSPINQLEFIGMCLGIFPEPFTFGLRAFNFLRTKLPDYDIIHDNQCLSYGIWGISRLGFPTVATVHHPITVDRDVELKAVKSWFRKLMVRRWYSFLGMQKWVLRRFSHIITVSESSKKDISNDFKVPLHKFRVVPNGINTDIFRPLPHIKRAQNQILTTNSADTPLKGLSYLLEAVASLRKSRDIRLTVIGTPKKNGFIKRLIRELGIQDHVKFTGRIEHEEFARYYAETTVAVIPSLYEGFGLPAGEAMACGIPVISTAGGALPEVVGDAGIIVPPADKQALEKAILSLLNDPERCQRLGQAGRERVRNLFTWKHAAQRTVAVYQEAIDANR